MLGRFFLERFSRMVASVAVVSVTAAGLTAQDPDEPLELDSLRVEASRRGAEVGGGEPLAYGWSPSGSPRPGALLDHWLAQSPAFSLYRRDPALTAHPTVQGVSLRQLGPTAASRSLVLKDGVPQNDPFGGWVPWSSYLPGGLAAVELLPAADASAWGPLTAAGAILLESPELDRAGGFVELAGGLPGAVDLQAAQRWSEGAWGAGVAGRWLDSRGDFMVHPQDRGPIDRRGDFSVRSLELRGGWQGPSERLSADGGWSWFEEERGNGSPLARNTLTGWESRVRLRGRAGAGQWESVAYLQRRSFSNQFTALNDDRTGESPVLNQFSIPSEALGGSFVWTEPLGPRGVRVLGVDGRLLEGTTNEDFSFGLDDRRRAGGKQRHGGLFALQRWSVAPEHTAEWVLRGDGWEISDGFRREFTLPSEERVLDAHYRDRTGFEPTGALRWRWAPSERLATRVGLVRSFRLPTINELYRPYRVGVDVFGANPQLEPERFTTLEAGWNGGWGERFAFASGLYLTRIENAVANLRRFEGPGPSDAGFVPPGGAYHRRENVERSWVRGWENRFDWRLGHGWTLRTSWLWQRATFGDVSIQPELEGKRFPLAPTHRWTVSFDYTSDRFGGTATLRGDSGMFDDAANERRLPASAQLDLTGWWRLPGDWQASLSIRNVSDETILTGVAGDGERSIAPGRSVWIALRWER